MVLLRLALQTCLSPPRWFYGGGPEFAFGLSSPGLEGVTRGEQLDPSSLCVVGRWASNGRGWEGKAEEPPAVGHHPVR